MDGFLASKANKQQLQMLLRTCISHHNAFKDVKVVLSGIGVNEPLVPCVIITAAGLQPLPQLDLCIEEADVRLMPHCLYAARAGCSRIVILSNDTDIIVLGIHCMRDL